MSRIRFEVSDTADVRFCLSPLWETVRSVYALADPGRHTSHLPWVRRARVLAADPDLRQHTRLLAAIARPGAWLPDFMTPPPREPVIEIEQELAAVAETPPEIVLADLAAVSRRSPPTPAVRALMARPAELLRQLVEAARTWHRVAISPEWPRMQALLEADIAHRSRVLAEGGIRRLFNTLHPTIRWVDGAIVADDPWDVELDLGGRGLPLMPSVFVDRRVLWTIRPDSAPFAIYPARAAATLWETPTRLSRPLAGVLGTTRAELLSLLQTPATTTELARRTGVSAAAVSQHLRALHQARLVGRSRHGRTVLYYASAAATALLEATGQVAIAG